MRVFLFSLFVLFSFASQADQLAYISKQDAERAAEKINKMSSVYLFCGCCSLVEPEKVKVIEAKVQHTGYENYYEVILTCEKENGERIEKALDLAYVWKKTLFGHKTIGKLLKLEHDPCVPLKKWNDPKYIEKDI